MGQFAVGLTPSSGNAAFVPAGSGGPDPASLARSGTLADIRAYLDANPDQRPAVEDALVRNARYGDIFDLAQQDRRAAAGAVSAPVAAPAAAQPTKYDTPIWTETRFGSGPTFRARPASDDAYRISGSGAWDGLVASGAFTASEKNVISRMADNEGRLDSVQAWDDQIVTVGSMQKTVNPAGHGELPRQVFAFSQSDPAHYAALFTDKGWAATHTGKGTGTGDYTMSLTVDGRTLTGADLDSYIKDKASPDHWTTALKPLQDAGRDPAFQAQQIRDFGTRLDTAIAVTPRSAVKGQSYDHPISRYVTSEQAAALVLDQSVNRPAHVAGTFGKALDSVFRAEPKADRNPDNWTAAQRADYEPRIVTAYAAERTKTTMTDAASRGTHITGRGSPLSAEPGSFIRSDR